MTFTWWCIIGGAVFITMALSGSILKRLPLTTALVYLGVGFALSVSGSGILQLDLFANVALLEHLAEVAVLIALFSVGLKIRIPLNSNHWWIPVRLAFGSMLITVGLITLVGVLFLKLPIGAAVLLGGILAPTDPALASDVQVEDPTDRDRLRFGLTGEAGLNDSTAFPFVLLGLGLLGLHNLGDWGWQWLAIDVLWGILAGLLTGALLGSLIGRLVVFLRREYKEAVGLDEFLTLGLVALSYGAAVLIHAYGFLAVFAAGLALRQVEVKNAGDQPHEKLREIAKVGKDVEVATHPEHAPAYLAQAILGFNEQLERIAEVAVVILIGGILATTPLPLEVLWFAPLLFFIIRPVSVEIGLIKTSTRTVQRYLTDWFGIRGVSSLYYLMYAIEQGLEPGLARQMAGLTLWVVALSIIVHGISVTPLMKFYERQQRKVKIRVAKPSSSSR